MLTFYFQAFWCTKRNPERRRSASDGAAVCLRHKHLLRPPPPPPPPSLWYLRSSAFRSSWCDRKEELQRKRKSGCQIIYRPSWAENSALALLLCESGFEPAAGLKRARSWFTAAATCSFSCCCSWLWNWEPTGNTGGFLGLEDRF